MVPRRDRSLKDFRQRVRPSGSVARRRPSRPRGRCERSSPRRAETALEPRFRRNSRDRLVQRNIPGTKVRHVLLKLGLSSPRPDCSVRHSHRYSRRSSNTSMTFQKYLDGFVVPDPCISIVVAASGDTAAAVTARPEEKRKRRTRG